MQKCSIDVNLGLKWCLQISPSSSFLIQFGIIAIRFNKQLNPCELKQLDKNNSWSNNKTIGRKPSNSCASKHSRRMLDWGCNF